MADSNNHDPNKPKKSWRDRFDDAVSRMGIVGELMRFLWGRKLWWMIPMIVALLLFGLLLVLGSSGAAPFIYTLF
jgi:hypothetical protein